MAAVFRLLALSLFWVMSIFHPKGQARQHTVAVFLDENSNYYFDRNFLEIPTKKYGFSNNVLPALRPATFPESSFTTDSSNSLIAINLK